MSGLSRDEIDTDRLRMRLVSEDDAPLYCELYGDPDTMRFVGPPLSWERAQRNFQTVLASLRGHRVERVLLVIVEKASQRAIGISAFQDFDVRRRRVEAGMMLGCGSCGRGFGKEGLSALVTHAFARFPVDEVWIQHAADNSSAKRVPVSLGLSHNTTAAYDDGSGRFIWSAYRESWCQQFPGRIEVSDQCQM